MRVQGVPHPKIVGREEWLACRKELLGQEKELTKHHDRVAAARRRLPMVRINKDYAFLGPDGKLTLLDLFKGRRQLIVYHFMFDPEWDEGCAACTGFVNDFGDLTILEKLDTTFVLVSRAPLEKLQAYQTKRGWDLPWFSSFGSDFNYDFHVTLDESIAPVEYNYRSKSEWQARGENSSFLKGEQHGLSVYFRLDQEVFHTYSSYARGNEGLTAAYGLLDVTPFGRQQDFEDSPLGWPQKPTYG